MNLNFNEICRLCLQFCQEYIDLSQTNGFKTLSAELMEKIQFCYFIQLDFSEGLPTKICYECIQVVTFFYVAKKNIIVGEELLRDLLSVKRKLQDRTEVNINKSVTSNINNFNLVRENSIENPSIASQDKLTNLNQNSPKLFEVESNCNKQSVDGSDEGSTESDLGKSSSVTAINDIVETNFENDFGLENKKEQGPLLLNSQKKDLGVLLNDPCNEVVLSLKFKDVKKLRNQDGINLEVAKG